MAARFCPDFLVTTACEHGYHIEQALTDTLANLAKVSYEGLFVDDLETRNSAQGYLERLCISYQQVSENALGQWLALQWQPAENPERSLLNPKP